MGQQHSDPDLQGRVTLLAPRWGWYSTHMTVDGYCTLGEDREYDLTPDMLLAALDAAEVDQAVIAPPDRWMAVRNTEGNDSMLAAARAHPDRFLPACTASPWNGAEACAELRRAAGEGARMFVLCPHVQGFMLGDEIAFPLAEVAAELALPVYVHTGSASASPFQLALVAEEHPEVNWIMGHAGRTDYWNDVPDAVLMAPNVYLERSFSLPEILRWQMETLPDERCIMGSAAPILPLEFEWSEMRRVFAPDGHPGLYGENLLALLREPSR